MRTAALWCVVALAVTGCAVSPNFGEGDLKSVKQTYGVDLPTDPQFSLKRLGEERYYLAVHQGGILISDGSTRAGILVSAAEHVAIKECAKDKKEVRDFRMQQQGDKGWVSVVGGFSCIAPADLQPQPAKSAPVADEPPAPAAGAVIASGSGFIIDKVGTIVTNNHVIAGCGSLSIAGGRNVVPAVLVAADAGLDLAAVRAQISAPVFPAIRTARADRLGEAVVVAGYPFGGILGSGLNITTGTVSALSGIANTSRYLQLTAPVHRGNSGGPLLDENGNVAGVVVAKLDPRIASLFGDTPQNVNFAIKSSVLRGFLEANAIEYAEVIPGKRLSTVELANKAKSFTVHVLCRK